MSEPWPKDLPLPKDDVFAIGVIALNYGWLEAIFQSLFRVVTEMTEAQAAAIFQRLSNDQRQDTLSELLAASRLPISLKDGVVHFSKAFKTCAENRHAVMHSRSGGILSKNKLLSPVLILEKTSGRVH